MSQPSTNEIRVLHVDDEPQFSELVATFLEKLDDNITVTTETNADSGLDVISNGDIDCVISDYQMPVMDGIEFLRAVRDEYPNLPFFLLTGRGSEEVASEAISAGVTSYIQKGGTEVYEQLAHRIQNAVSHRQSERRAEVARNRLLELYEQTDGFFILDSEWTIKYWNQQMANRTGRSVESVLNKSFLNAFPQAKGTELYTHYQEAMEAREAVEFETYYEPHDYWVYVNVLPVDEGLFVHSREVTEEKERIREIQRRNHILESFANTVSHDLRNPLNVAEGKLELAQKTGDFDHLEEVAQAHNRMRNLITELLRVARGDDLALTDVSLANSAERAWETVTSEDMDLIIEDEVTFEAHESQLRRLFENLFWNAFDHGEASTIRVGLTDNEGIYIEDDGTGIAVADRETIFESGFSTQEEGPGYGLSIVKGICGTHGWEIAVKDGKSGGARFEITGLEL